MAPKMMKSQNTNLPPLHHAMDSSLTHYRNFPMLLP